MNFKERNTHLFWDASCSPSDFLTLSKGSALVGFDVVETPSTALSAIGHVTPPLGGGSFYRFQFFCFENAPISALHCL
jgi:hypothetical protein